MADGAFESPVDVTNEFRMVLRKLRSRFGYGDGKVPKDELQREVEEAVATTTHRPLRNVQFELRRGRLMAHIAPGSADLFVLRNYPQHGVMRETCLYTTLDLDKRMFLEPRAVRSDVKTASWWVYSQKLVVEDCVRVPWYASMRPLQQRALRRMLCQDAPHRPFPTTYTAPVPKLGEAALIHVNVDRLQESTFHRRGEGDPIPERFPEEMPRGEEHGIEGGNLVAYAGFGKTMLMTALIYATARRSPSPPDAPPRVQLHDPFPERTATLIVAPPNLVEHWKVELRKWWPRCSVVVLYGGTANISAGLRMEAPDVVITSLPTLSRQLSELASLDDTHVKRNRMQSHMVLEAYKRNGIMSELKPRTLHQQAAMCIIKTPWRRIIVDEAHANSNAINGYMCALLDVWSVWGLTATPSIIGRYSSVMCKEYDRSGCFTSGWERTIVVGMDLPDSHQGMLKEIVADAKEALRLPQATMIIHETQRPYTCSDGLEYMKKTSRAGVMEALSLADFGDTGEPEQSDAAESAPSPAEAIPAFQEATREAWREARGCDPEPCCNCGNRLRTAFVMPCRHVVCKVCMQDAMVSVTMRKTIKCVMCDGKAPPQAIVRVECCEGGDDIEAEDSSVRAAVLSTIETASSRADHVCKWLMACECSPDDAFIIFVPAAVWAKRFTEVMSRHGVGSKFNVSDASATSSIQARGTSIRKWRKRARDSESMPAIIVANEISCATGLNLPEANHVVFPYQPHCWEAIYQMYSRAHRFGQDRPVSVHFFCSASGVESSLLRLLIRRKAGLRSQNTWKARQALDVVFDHVQRRKDALSDE